MVKGNTFDNYSNVDDPLRRACCDGRRTSAVFCASTSLEVNSKRTRIYDFRTKKRATEDLFFDLTFDFPSNSTLYTSLQQRNHQSRNLYGGVGSHYCFSIQKSDIKFEVDENTVSGTEIGTLVCTQCYDLLLIFLLIIFYNIP